MYIWLCKKSSMCCSFCAAFPSLTNYTLLMILGHEIQHEGHLKMGLRPHVITNPKHAEPMMEGENHTCCSGCGNQVCFFLLHTFMQKEQCMLLFLHIF
jgi:hypothetical protein